METGRGFVIHC